MSLVKCSTLTAAQRQVLMDFMAQAPFTDIKHQYDGVTITLEAEPSFIEELTNADLRAALIELSRSKQTAGPATSSTGNAAAGSSTTTAPFGRSLTSEPAVPTHAAGGGGSGGGGSHVRSLGWLRALMDDIYTDRWRAFETESPQSIPSVDDLSVHTFSYLSHRFGVDSLVRQASVELLGALRAYRTAHFDVQLFGLLLGSSAYDTIDVKHVLSWRRTLMPFTRKVGKTPCAIYVKMIPAFVRKCLAECSSSLKCRVRRGLTTWCNIHGAFPSLVADPNFYCPPFHRNNPYVGKAEGAVPIDVEQTYAYCGQQDSVIDVHHLLIFLLLNHKQERIAQQHHGVSPPRTPILPRDAARREAELTTLMSPTFSSLAKHEPVSLSQVRRSPARAHTPNGRGQRSSHRSLVADLSPADAAVLARAVAADAVDIAVDDMMSSPPAAALNRAKTVVLSRQPSFGDSLSNVPLPAGTSLADVEAGVAEDMEQLEAKLARVVNSFVRNRPHRSESGQPLSTTTSSAAIL